MSSYSSSADGASAQDEREIQAFLDGLGQASEEQLDHMVLVETSADGHTAEQSERGEDNGWIDAFADDHHLQAEACADPDDFLGSDEEPESIVSGHLEGSHPEPGGTDGSAQPHVLRRQLTPGGPAVALDDQVLVWGHEHSGQWRIMRFGKQACLCENQSNGDQAYVPNRLLRAPQRQTTRT